MCPQHCGVLKALVFALKGLHWGQEWWFSTITYLDQMNGQLKHARPQSGDREIFNT